MIIADAEQLTRVLHNIINNSVKYTDKEDKIIYLRVSELGDEVQISLEDNGKGIASGDLANIFDRFYRTDSSRHSEAGGSGIVNPILSIYWSKAHDGMVEASKVEVVRNDPLGDRQSSEQIAAKYREVDLPD